MFTSSVRSPLGPCAVLALAVLACRSSVESQAADTTSSSQASTGVGGAGGRSSSGGGSQLVGAGGRGGAGGGFGGACAEAVIHVEIDGSPVGDLDACCPWWGCNVSSRPVGYFFSGGPHLLGNLVVDGCTAEGALRLRADAILSGGAAGGGGGPQNPTSLEYTDPGGALFQSDHAQPGGLELTSLGAVGQVIVGTISGVVDDANGSHAVTASFSVCHVPDENVP